MGIADDELACGDWRLPVAAKVGDGEHRGWGHDRIERRQLAVGLLQERLGEDPSAFQGHGFQQDAPCPRQGVAARPRLVERVGGGDVLLRLVDELRETRGLVALEDAGQGGPTDDAGQQHHAHQHDEPGRRRKAARGRIRASPVPLPSAHAAAHAHHRVARAWSRREAARDGYIGRGRQLHAAVLRELAHGGGAGVVGGHRGGGRLAHVRHLPEEAAFRGRAPGCRREAGRRTAVADGSSQGRQLLGLGQGRHLRQPPVDT